MITEILLDVKIAFFNEDIHAFKIKMESQFVQQLVEIILKQAISNVTTVILLVALIV